MIFVKTAEEKMAQEKGVFMRQNTSMWRSWSCRGGNRDVSAAPRPDGWPVACQGAARPQPKAGNLSQFGKINKVAPMSIAPTSVFYNKRGDTLAPAAIWKGEAKSKIDKDVKEFFRIRLLNVAESYFSSLPIEHRHHLVDTLVMKSIKMWEPDVKLVSDLFVRVREKDLRSPVVFEEGFNGLAELLDDLAIDIPKAWLYFAILLKGSGLDQDKDRYERIAEKTMDPIKLHTMTGRFEEVKSKIGENVEVFFSIRMLDEAES